MFLDLYVCVCETGREGRSSIPSRDREHAFGDLVLKVTIVTLSLVFFAEQGVLYRPKESVPEHTIDR